MPPSKGKKKPQQPAAASPQASPQASPRTPSSSRSSRDRGGDGEGSFGLPSVAAAAAARFPALVPRGGAGCFVGAVAEVAPRGGSGGGGLGRLWLSEAAMVGSGMRPGSLVSVSLISSRSEQLERFPLGDLSEECNRFFDLDVDNDLLYGEAGRNFVVATVFPSREVQKNGIKLSWDLACVLGYPAVGRSLFINPLCTSQDPKHSDDVDVLRVIKCKDLYLGLVPPEVGSSSAIQSESDYRPERNEILMETPKKSPFAPLHRRESHNCASSSGSSVCLDPTTVRSALADEKVNELLQTSASRWLNGRHLLKGNFIPLSMCGKLSLFVVMGAEFDSSARDDLCEKGNTLPNAEDSFNLGKTLVSILVDRTTKVHLSDSVCIEKLGSDKLHLPLEIEEYDSKKNEDTNHAPMLGGLSTESATIKDIITFSLADEIGLPRYKGILLYGPPGTGKTSLASSCAYAARANLFTINGPEIISQYYGESEQSLYDVFNSAKKAAPAVIFVDELDAIAPSRMEGGEELSIRMVATLLKLMDEIGPNDRVLLIAATNRPDSIDPALRRSVVAPRFLSASYGLMQRAAYASGGIVDVGQPTPQSHPELLADGEITPGIPKEEYISRRKKLLEVLPEKSLAIIASADQQMMTDVVPYPFRQNGDYLYITGCTQPGGVAVLSEETGLCMFMPDTNKEDVVWQGQTAGVQAAVEFFKADKAFPLSEMQKILPEMIERSKGVYHSVKTSSPSYKNLDAFRRASLNNKVKDLTHYTDELRWIKSKFEIKLMRESASIVSQSLLQTMLLSRTHREESQLAAKIEYECKMRGAQRMAFHPVVGGGANASVIHYSRNDRKIKTGDLLLMDVGCEYHGYLSDLTRTWPPCGRFSPAQEELYSLILETNKECIKLCKPGTSINEIHNHSVKMLIKGFQELGILEKGKSIQYNYLNPTAIGHSLGMDIHDSVTLPKDKPLEPGVVITIEPGVYIPPAPILNESAPGRYRGIGIRIEDEVLVTEDGHEVLTASVPKEIPHLTTLMSMGSGGRP